MTFSFEYRAARCDGGVESGLLTANSEGEALQVLQAHGLLVAELRLRNESNDNPLAAVLGSRTIPIAQLALGLRLLADFLESGLSVARSLSALEEMAPSAWRAVLPNVRGAIRNGRSLAGALAESPVRFPPLVIGLIRAGETGMGLAIGARRAAEVMEEAAAMRTAVSAAMAYPLVLLLAGATSLCLLVGVVIPHFVSLLADLGETLPLTTRTLLRTFSAARAAFFPASVLCAVALACWRAWTSTAAGARDWEGFLLRLPLIGSTRLTMNTSRITGSLGALLEAGVPISNAVQIAATASNDAMLAARWLEARADVVRGESLSDALRTRHAATATTIRLARAGEESGRLAAMLTHASRLDREEALRRTRSAVRMLEPTLILIFGALVAFVAAALLQALYGIRPT